MSQQTDTRVLDDIDLSNRQESRLSTQLAHAIKSSGIVEVGRSRYDAKADARANGAKTSHDINATIGITSWASYDKFCSQVKVFGSWCFGNGCNNLNQIKPEHVTGFLRSLIDCGYARNTVQGYAAAINKMAVMIERGLTGTGTRAAKWSKAIDTVRADINTCVQKDTATRAYADPHAIVAAMPDERLQLCASMQLNHGLRIADATKINTHNISADDKFLTVKNSKNGQDITVALRPGEADHIRALADGNGMVAVKQSEYRAALSKACTDTGQDYNGSHGLRHNYAQNRMDALTSSGMSYTKALDTVASEMGHHRAEITHTYLR